MFDLVIMHVSPFFLWEIGTGKVEFDYQCHDFASVRVERRRSSRTNLVSEPKSRKSPLPLYPHCRLLLSLSPPLWCRMEQLTLMTLLWVQEEGSQHQSCDCPEKC